MKTKKKSMNQVGNGWNFFFTILLTVIAILTLAPLALMVIISFSSTKSIEQIGYSYFPIEWSLEGYKYVIKTGTQIVNSYIVTAANSVFGTLLTLALTSMYAFVLCQDKFKAKKFLLWFAYFTALFGAGLVPSYMMNVRYYHLKDTFWILLLRGLINPGWIIMMRAFVKTTVPEALFDSARIDGAGYGVIYLKIVMPLLKAGLATIGLFSFVGRWNDWYAGMLYITSPKLTPLQTLLTRMQDDVEFLKENSQLLSSPAGLEMLKNLPGDNLRMACTMVVILPVLLAYPFFQRYFVQGLVVGSVKG